MFSDEVYMRRCIDLARAGIGHVSPNPMVGSVIVYKDTIIGEGYHHEYGKAHAEVNAIDSVTDKSLLKEATLYVNLEPCSHYGKTPPCADRIILEGIPRVVIGNIDPFSEVNGRGIEKLRNAGVKVTVGVLEKKCSELNKTFFTFHEKRRPYIILKWAETADGFIARKDFSSKWISNPYSRMLVHQWRSEIDAVMVGANTAIHDNPSLTVRETKGRNPIRITMLRDGILPLGFHLLDGEARTIIFTENKSISHPNVEYVPIEFSANLPEQILAYLYTQNIQSILIEGGANLLSQFISKNLWDEARIFKAPVHFDEGIPAPVLDGELVEKITVDTDELFICRNKNG